MNKISVIIPAYREEKSIWKTLEDLQKKGFWKSEIIIIDWSPDDLTKNIVDNYLNKKLNIIYKKLENSFRSGSMNKWAEISTWNLLLFLHADTILPENSFEKLEKLNLDEKNYWCFYKKFTPNNIFLELISKVNNFQTKYFWTMLWDNAIFVSKEKFDEIWWFQNIKLMEDIELSKTLKKQGSMEIIKEPLLTSSRKFQKKWAIKTFLFMQYIRFLYFIWTDTKKLEKKYRSF